MGFGVVYKTLLVVFGMFEVCFILDPKAQTHQALGRSFLTHCGISLFIRWMVGRLKASLEIGAALFACCTSRVLGLGKPTQMLCQQTEAPGALSSNFLVLVGERCAWMRSVHT